MDNRHFTADDLERLLHEAAKEGARAALASITLSPAPPQEAAPGLPAWCSTAEYAEFSGKSAKTIRDYARRAPPELARKYGRDWRIAGPAFDAWVLAGGPFRVHVDEPQVH